MFHSVSTMNATSKTPVFCSSSFDWKNKKGTANKSELFQLGYAADETRGIAVKSARTGIVKYFEPVYDEDGYDGEFMVYSCDDEVFVTIWNY